MKTSFYGVPCLAPQFHSHKVAEYMQCSSPGQDMAGAWPQGFSLRGEMGWGTFCIQFMEIGTFWMTVAFHTPPPSYLLLT